jgi:HD superfamily phosphohydrolase
VVKPNRCRIYHDPLHGAITLFNGDATEALLIRLIDTPEFQRLRRIRQLGPASLTFHGAESSRFTHSLGVMALARRAMDALEQLYPELQAYRSLVLVATLLHDLGHGPLSHTSEDIFGSQHEAWTARILQESPTIRSLLQAFSAQLPEQLLAIYQKRYPVPLVWQLVSSQLDCDRLDYLLRDSYYTGASYGHLDLDRILSALRYDSPSQQLVVCPKGQAAIEHYLVVRSLMYSQVYNHRKSFAATWILKQIMERARLLHQQQRLGVDETLGAWLQAKDCNHLPLETYLRTDDVLLLYHLQRWQFDDDQLLGDLCRRYNDRDLLKAANVSQWSPAEQQSKLAQVKKAIAALGWDPEVYGGLCYSQSRGYTLYQQGILVRLETCLQDLSEISPLVQTLSRQQRQTWLIYPREVEAIVERLT